MNLRPVWIRKFGIATLALLFVALLSAAVSRAQDQEKKPEEQKGPKAASVEVTPKTGNAQLGDQLQFKAVAKDAAGNLLDMKPTVWFAAPFDAATADVNGVVHFTSPGEITVGAVFGEQITRWIARNGHLRSHDHIRARSAAAAIEIKDFGAVPAQVTYGRIYLRQRNLHAD